MKLDLESDGNETFGSGSGCYKFGGLQDSGGYKFGAATRLRTTDFGSGRARTSSRRVIKDPSM